MTDLSWENSLDNAVEQPPRQDNPPRLIRTLVDSVMFTPNTP
ncbi:hypothetical protein ACIBF5_22620 [Micromonospora sp. NPDC050417]